jgi:hypothetical protein
MRWDQRSVRNFVGGMKRLRKQTDDLIHTKNRRSEWLNELYLPNQVDFQVQPLSRHFTPQSRKTRLQSHHILNATSS